MCVNACAYSISESVSVRVHVLSLLLAVSPRTLPDVSARSRAQRQPSRLDVVNLSTHQPWPTELAVLQQQLEKKKHRNFRKDEQLVITEPVVPLHYDSPLSLLDTNTDPQIKKK